MFKGYPRRHLNWLDYFWMILTSSLVVQFIAGIIGGVFVAMSASGNLDMTQMTVVIGKITIYASILSLVLSGLVIHFRKIPIVNRKQLSSDQWVLIPGLSRKDWQFLLKYIPLSYLVYVSGSMILEMLIGPQAEVTNQAAIESMFNDVPTILLFIMIVIVAPIVEEWLFRGMILCRRGDQTGSVISVIVSSLIFAAVHAPNNITAWYTYGAMGLMFSYAVYKTKSVEAGIVYHMLNNLLGFIMILVLS